MARKISLGRTFHGLLVTLALLISLGSAEAYRLPEDLTELSLEALANVEVTIASRKAQKLTDSAAAAFVITQEDIRRSGVTSIPEALRMVPGLEVARIDANKWAITARGFNGLYAAKLLVLMDGRTVYSPLFSGVHWEQQDTLIEDIERIEVIRGPGATLWGANAVNGVINIITRNAEQTTGGLVTAGGGTEEKGFGSFRYGARVKDTFYRVYGKFHSRGPLVTERGHNASDSWEATKGGFRVDSALSDRNRLTVQGDYAHGHFQNEYQTSSLTEPYVQTLKGGFHNTANLLGRWNHTYSDTSNLSFQAYYDWTEKGGPQSTERRNTFDFDLQHRFAMGRTNDIVWGLGYRRTEGYYRGNAYYVFDPPTRRDDLFSGFLQDDILLIPERLHLILGSKFEHNDYTGFEVQPSIRTVWTPDGKQTVWGSISRAVRTPSWGEANASVIGTVLPPLSPANPYPFPAAISLNGDRDFVSEKLMAYEIGYRFHPADAFSLDLAAFYNDYSDLRSVRMGTTYPVGTGFPPDYVVTPFIGNNRMDGKTYGCELALEWKPYSFWRLQGSYTYLHVSLDVKQGSMMFVETSDGASPHHQFSLRSSFDLTETLEFDGWIRYAGRIRTLNVPSYLTLDLRLGWKPIPQVELSLVGQNLLQKRHKEFGSSDLQTASGVEIPRGFYGKVTWRF